MSRIRRLSTRTLSSFRIRNFRLYFAAQLVSVTGTWMQTVAQDLLILDLTGSGTAVGIAAALQFLPLLLGGAWTGVLADRLDRRRLLVVAQAAMAVQAVLLAVLVLTGTATVELVWSMSLLLGLCNMFSLPARQAFLHDIVGETHLANAVALNSAVQNAGRVLGPAAAGVVVALWGAGPAFLANAVTFLAGIAALLAMDPRSLCQGRPAKREPGQIRAGLAYAWTDPVLRRTFLLVAVVGTVGYNFRVTVPLLGKVVFGEGPETIGLLFSAMALGAFFAALFTASRRSPTQRLLWGTTVVFGGSLLLTALAPSVELAAVTLVAVGAAGVTFMATANARLQLHTESDMRGRIMALFVILVLGSTPIGGPAMGWVADVAGTRIALAVGGAMPLIGVAWAWLDLRREQRDRLPEGEPRAVGEAA